MRLTLAGRTKWEFEEFPSDIVLDRHGKVLIFDPDKFFRKQQADSHSTAMEPMELRFDTHSNAASGDHETDGNGSDGADEGSTSEPEVKVPPTDSP